MSDARKPDRAHSWGNIDDGHWSRARKDLNQEALDYYRERSKAPGVADGGGARNFYCMKCDGVIDFELAAEVCPHCGAALDDKVKRYFNWVEINDAPKSDLRALAVRALLVAAIVAVIALAAWLWISRR